MATVELVYPQSPVLDHKPPVEFKMNVKDGPYEEDLTDEQFQGQLLYVRSVPPEKTIFLVGAMNSQMDFKTGRMRKDAQDVIKTIDQVCRACGLHSCHCFGFQEFGKYRVTSNQATVRDEILTQRSRKFIALDTTPESSNAPTEVRYRLWLGMPVIALIRCESPKVEYRKWFIEQVGDRPYTDPISYILTYDGLPDLAQALPQLLGDGIRE